MRGINWIEPYIHTRVWGGIWDQGSEGEAVGLGHMPHVVRVVGYCGYSERAQKRISLSHISPNRPTKEPTRSLLMLGRPPTYADLPVLWGNGRVN